MTKSEKTIFTNNHQFSLSIKEIKDIEKLGLSKKMEDEDIGIPREQMELHLVFIRKFFAESRSASDFKLGNDYLEFVDEKGNIFHIRKTKITGYISFNQNEYYHFKLNKRGQTKYILSKEIEVFNHGGNIITHDFNSNRYFNYSKYLEVDCKFKPVDN